jgi:general stress protein 26
MPFSGESLMFTDTIREFLQKPLIARMSTLDSEGYPHTVPVWFALDGDDLVIISVRQTAKVGHILANPKGAVTIGGDPGNGAGYLIKGHFSIESDPDATWTRKLTYRYESPEQAEKDITAWADLDMIVLRLKPKVVLKVI